MSTPIKVAVLMSTYNGEKYLSEQIESILAQEDVDVYLYVRDDGSTDHTKDIIKKYQRKSPNILFVAGKNLGVGNSFMTLLYSASPDFDYYAFSDQDDIWLKNKIVSAVQKLKNDSIPKLYCSNQILIDKFGNHIGIRYTKDPNVSCEQSFSINHITGCTMVWNQPLQLILQDKKYRPSVQLLNNRIHDVWVGVVAGLVGNVIYDSSSYILYRQHENNVVGAKSDGPLETLESQLKKLKDSKYRNGRSRIATEVCDKFPGFVIRHPLIESASKIKTLSGKIEIIKRESDFRSYTRESKFSFVLKVLFGFF